MNPRSPLRHRCADCGEELIWHPARFSWSHKVRPADDHAPRMKS